MSTSLVRRRSFRFTDPSLDVSDLAAWLSPFQIEKLSYLFKCLDQSGNGILDVGTSAVLFMKLLANLLTSITK